MPPFPTDGAQAAAALCASDAEGTSARKKSSAAAPLIFRMKLLFARLIVLLAVEPGPKRREFRELVLLLRCEVAELALKLGHLQLAQFLELLHLLDRDHVADLDRLQLGKHGVLARKLSTLQSGRGECPLDSTKRVVAPLRVGFCVVDRHRVA